MRLLYISKYQFHFENNELYSLPAYGNAFWQKYMDVFDGLDVLGEEVRGYLNNGTLTKISDSRINVMILPPNTNPKDFVNDRTIKRKLAEQIKKADAVLIKPSARKGIMAIKICKKLNKPYMIELTGDLKLTLSMNSNPIKRLYGPIIYRQIVNAIKDCHFGLYVTQDYLQKVFPIIGLQCGCTDTEIPDPDNEALNMRIKNINSFHEKFKLGIVASYHDNRKGLDTAIEALALITNKVELHVLGVGTEQDQIKWFEYAKRLGVEKQLIFDSSLSGIEKVLRWNDGIDVQILPSRSEGLPRCVIEGMSRAVPCIISNVCGMPELVDSKWLHKPGDAKTLASLVDEMLNSRDLQLEAANKNFIKSYEYTQKTLKARRNEFLLKFRDYAIKNNAIK